MRPGILLTMLSLCVAPALGAQAKNAQRDLERFDVSGIPATLQSDLERQILLFVKVHRKGDLTDATRIHMMLAQYYKEHGDARRADACTRLAAEAYGAPSAGPSETADVSGKPPFEPQATFRRTFVYTDDVNLEHTWEFYVDGTFSHMVSGSPQHSGPRESGWYTRTGRDLRLWQSQPKGDRTVEFELIGPNGSEGAVMAGVRMKVGS